MANIAVVVLDTLRKETFDEYFKWLPGKRFENCWSPSHWTVPVHAALFTGQRPVEVGTYARSLNLDCDLPTIAEILSSKEYTTRAFSTNPNISKRFRFHRGFDEFRGNWRLRHFNRDDLFDWDTVAGEGEGVFWRYAQGVKECIQSDSATFPSLYNGVEMKLGHFGLFDKYKDQGAAEALQYISGTNFTEDEFLFLNLMEVHAPYEVPSEYQSTTTPTFLGIEETINNSSVDGKETKQGYEECAGYLSDKYSEIFSELSKDFDWIVTLSDHGELFGENGAWRHGYGVYPELTHVPLVISDTSGNKETVSEVVSITDVYDTILDITGLADQMQEMNSLIGDVHGKEVLTSYHGITHQHKVDTLRDRGFDSRTIEQYDAPVYGLVSKDGEYIYRDVHGVHGFPDIDKVTEEAEQILNSAVDEISSIDRNDNKIDLNDSARSQLEELGYI
ncbi:sulfatase-like hydrolase/transferase [Halosimplex pelagicum]|uniref:Sulfatase-like hydrolase/transferase n=1 Tax=Halosimplex pelagicum TaxID=869886 RepID=A0A7D5T2M0_9EURY|nr:sulfatase-like hydrolase/transferase [Halosimplex pelagicum]QLH81271.1 sulfatase-like hydrolase/transferase [Halosimplex pelagicum]